MVRSDVLRIALFVRQTEVETILLPKRLFYLCFNAFICSKNLGDGRSPRRS
jgi:hypothetical protein